MIKTLYEQNIDCCMNCKYWQDERCQCKHIKIIYPDNTCCTDYARNVMDAIKVKPYDNRLVFNQKIDGYYSSAREIEDAFQAVGIIVRAKINRLCNEEKFDEAKELEEALIKINTADYNH